MIRKCKDMSCEQFTACMAELIAAGEDIFAHPHLRRCKLHRALLDDLEAIAKAARQLFPDVDPPDSVWEGIQSRMTQGRDPDPIVSDLWSGYRVVFSMQVIEQYNPNASPPALDCSFAEENSIIGPRIFGAMRTFPRREGRR